MIPVVDLFAGAGGFAVATRRSRLDLRLSVELDDVCCKTLGANDLGDSHRVVKADVRDIGGGDLREWGRIAGKDPLIIVGGPPCQPFSKASYWTDPGEDSSYRRSRAKGVVATRPAPITEAKKDSRRDLLLEFQRLVFEASATGFVMENVQSLLHPRNRAYFEEVVEGFRANGYHCTVVKADATEFGVPQKRARIFVLGSLHRAPTDPTLLRPAQSSPVAVRPFIERFSGPEFSEKEEVFVGRWADALSRIPPGWNYKYLTEWAGNEDPLFVAETRFWNFLLKLDPNLPSWTINANPGPWVGPFHWDNRRLRIPELAAIQTFPENYRFSGSRREMIRQIGNAVPSLFASEMINAVVEAVS